MDPCHTPPPDRKAFAQTVANKLQRTHGPQRFYSPDQVRSAVTYLGHPVDLVCWAMVLFTTPDDFAANHLARGEVCDYVAMKEVMLQGIASDSVPASGLDFGWLRLPSVDLSWLDWAESVSGWFDWTH